ncbi:MAG: 16S rRNA (cytidine(1402)-2'-O)-methyltransferase [Chloroflexi bacterium]|nr:16S rRNA (cytidine(1402)-2'-O)-methyltransferase [Chloroflexota bacterium]
MNTLYLVATPIGNLEDITVRALRVLKEVALIAAEDTRRARVLLTRLQIHTPLTSYFEHNKSQKLDALLAALERGDVAIISEAGTPGISDPGYELVRAALARHARVVPIPGASAITTALVASGLPSDQFVYLGFLPRQKNARRKFLRARANESRTLIAFEAPHRVRAALEDIAATLGNRQICLAREMTKMFEEFFRGTVEDARAHCAQHAPRGEFTLVIGEMKTESGKQKAKSAEDWTEVKVRAAVKRLIARGRSRTDAVKQVARASGRERRAVYKLVVSH